MALGALGSIEEALNERLIEEGQKRRSIVWVWVLLEIYLT